MLEQFLKISGSRCTNTRAFEVTMIRKTAFVSLLVLGLGLQVSGLAQSSANTSQNTPKYNPTKSMKAYQKNQKKQQKKTQKSQEKAQKNLQKQRTAGH